MKHRSIRVSILAPVWALALAVAVSCGGQAGVPALDDAVSTAQIEVVAPDDTAVAPPSTAVAAATGQAAPPTTGAAAPSDNPGNPGGQATSDRPPSTGPASTSRTPAPPAGSASAPSAQSVVAHAVVPTVVARSGPGSDTAVVAELANPIASGAELVFRAVDGGAQDPEWIQVLLPVEPNGTVGWVSRADVTLTTSPYRIVIDRASFTLRAFYQGELWLEATIGVGTGRTPTPVGDFYLLELLAPPDPTGPYGPYAFGLSGFSEVLDGFAGSDDAIIGLHGTNDPSSLGTKASHGCIRLANDVIEQLAANVPLGTPVTIT